MYKNILQYLCFSFFILISMPAISDLAPSEINAFIKESDLIARIEVLKVEYPPLPGKTGRTQIKVKEVIYSKLQTNLNETFWLKMFHEIHDNNIDDKHKGDWLIFLRKNDKGEFTGTQYGRSYLQIHRDDKSKSCSQYLIYDSPLNLVKIPENLFKENSNPQKKILCLEQLIAYIQEQVKTSEKK